MMMRFLLLSAALLMQATTEARDCFFDIVINGNALHQESHCFEARDESGVTATVQGRVTSGIVVWDADAPCGEGEAFIHYSGGPEFLPMTSGAGASIHTYRAAYFDDVPAPTSLGCQEFDVKYDPYCMSSWQVARHRTWCDFNARN